MERLIILPHFTEMASHLPADTHPSSYCPQRAIRYGTRSTTHRVRLRARGTRRSRTHTGEIWGWAFYFHSTFLHTLL